MPTLVFISIFFPHLLSWLSSNIGQSILLFRENISRRLHEELDELASP